jgi:hypothetical protein
MRLRVLRLYDDAWGTAQVIGGEAAEMGRQGAFPIVSDSTWIWRPNGERDICDRRAERLPLQPLRPLRPSRTLRSLPCESLPPLRVQSRSAR